MENTPRPTSRAVVLGEGEDYPEDAMTVLADLADLGIGPEVFVTAPSGPSRLRSPAVAPSSFAYTPAPPRAPLHARTVSGRSPAPLRLREPLRVQPPAVSQPPAEPEPEASPVFSDATLLFGVALMPLIAVGAVVVWLFLAL